MLLQQKIDDDKKVIAKAVFQAGQQAEQKIDYRTAMEQFELAVTLEPENAEYLNEAGMMAYTLGQYADAQRWFEKLVKIHEQNNPDTAEHATALNNLALLYKSQGKYGAAELLFQRAIEIGEKTLGKDHPKVATWLNNLAYLYVSQKKYAEAKLLYQRTIAILEKIFPDGHPNLTGAKQNYLIARLQIDMNKPEEAIEKIKQAIAEGKISKEELELLLQ